MTPDQRQFALAKYGSDRTHELELDRAVGEFERAFFQGLFVLNGGAPVALLSFAGSNLHSLEATRSLVIWSTALWLLGFVTAYVAGWLAYSGQKQFVAAFRNRRNAIALKLNGSHDAVTIGGDDTLTAVDLADEVIEAQRRGHQRWNEALRVGAVSVAMFVAGVVCAACAIIPAG